MTKDGDKDVKEQKRKREGKFKRGELALNILEILSHGAIVSSAILLAFAPGTTYQMVKGLRRAHKNIRGYFKDAHERQRVYSLLTYLRQAGLVAKEKRGNAFVWMITDKGKSKKLDLDRQLSKTITVALPTIYTIDKSDKLIIIIFDIPEREKHKRNWFRSVLKNLGFSLVQKSVWTGWVKVPAGLMSDLKELNLLDHIKIFSAVEIGNLD